MVFSWNMGGLGQSRAVGFEPATEFRFAEPEPDASASMGALRPHLETVTDPDPNAAWAFWSDSDARDHLRGLALDSDESWACSALTRGRLATAADEDRLLAVADADALAGFAVRTRVTERETDNETIRTATYGTAAWRDVDAGGAVRRDCRRRRRGRRRRGPSADPRNGRARQRHGRKPDPGGRRARFRNECGPHGRTMSLFGVALPWSLPLTLVIYGVVVAAAVWIYRDAKARGSRYAIVWALATLLFTIVPVLAYLYLHRDAGPARSERPDR